MTHHSIICRLNAEDTAPIALARADTRRTEIPFVDGERRLGYGIGQAMDQLLALGLRPSERAVDLALLAAVINAADTRISRDSESQDGWTREIDLYIPVADPVLWSAQGSLLGGMLRFLTGDHWAAHFRPRITTLPELAAAPKKPRSAQSSCVCLLSGGLDSFIGATDLLKDGQRPALISHYWDGTASTSQDHIVAALRTQYPDAPFHHVSAHVGFPKGIIQDSAAESSQRARSFLFFALASLTADALGGDKVINVPENGLISLNVPLDPLRLGALSTRTTHPYYMARFNDLLLALGLTTRLENRYRYRTKGQMVRDCIDAAFLAREYTHTMSCSDPFKYRFAEDKSLRKRQHCGHCVPCLIRRASLLAGLGRDDTPYAIDLHTRVLDTAKPEGEHIRAFQFLLAALDNEPGRARFDIHKPGPLLDYPDDWHRYEKVYVEGLDEVRKLLSGVQARSL